MEEISQVVLDQLEVLSSSAVSSSELGAKKFEDNKITEKIAEEYQIPKRYQQNKLMLQVRNPKTAYLYWDYTDSQIIEAINNAGYDHLQEASLVLRVYNLSLSQSYDVYYDQEVKLEDDNWYLNNLNSGNEYQVRLAVKGSNDSLSFFLESNKINMPVSNVSNICDEKWMTVKEKMDIIYLLSGVLPEGGLNSDISLSSADLIKKKIRRIKEEELIELFDLSGGISSEEFSR